MPLPAEPEIATREEWLARRRALLADEKALTREKDRIAEQRRNLPWVPVDVSYSFDTPDGPRSLVELFGPHDQLLVYHFMFGEDWEVGCPSCSFWASNFDGTHRHLADRHVSFWAISTAPLARLLEYRERMGWSFPWASSGGNSFNQDFGVTGSDMYNFVELDEPIDEMPGVSAFALRDGQVFHTYSAYARGLDVFNGAYQLLDMVPAGRDEHDLPWSMAWLQRHEDIRRQG